MEIGEKLQIELVELYSDLDLDALLLNIAEKIKKYLNCEEASIFLYNREKEELYFEAATGDKKEELKKIVVKKGDGAAGWIAKECESLIINDCRNDERFGNIVDEKTNFITSSILGAPVMSNDELIGVVEAINKKDNFFTEEDSDLLNIFTGFISIPLQNAILFKKTIRESEEKGLLIELGKTVSNSFNYTEVFETLKSIITDHIMVNEINVMVNSTGKLFKLCEDSGKKETERIDLTRIERNSVMFPLRTEEKVIGFLEIKSDSIIPESFISLLRGLSIYTAISINKYEMYCELLEKERIEKEIQIARDIQQSFLLKKKLDIKKIDYSFINIPSSKVGGDYFDVIKFTDDESIFSINDIAGHGIPASLLMSVFRTNFIYRIKRDMNISKTMSYLNNLIAETTEPNLYLTSFTIKIDVKKRFLEYLNCGHNPQFIVRDGNAIDLSEGTTVLGMFPDIETPVSHVNLKKDDIIVLYTDGVIEEENEKGEQFSIERLKNLIIMAKDLNSEEIKAILIKELRDYSKNDKFNDDITFIIVKIK